MCYVSAGLRNHEEVLSIRTIILLPIQSLFLQYQTNVEKQITKKKTNAHFYLTIKIAVLCVNSNVQYKFLVWKISTPITLPCALYL